MVSRAQASGGRSRTVTASTTVSAHPCALGAARPPDDAATRTVMETLDIAARTGPREPCTAMLLDPPTCLFAGTWPPGPAGLTSKAACSAEATLTSVTG